MGFVSTGADSTPAAVSPVLSSVVLRPYASAARTITSATAAPIHTPRSLFGGDVPGSDVLVAAVVPLRRPSWFELSHLFVAPERFGQGIGRALFGAAVALVTAKGATHVSILSDPHDAAFYEKLGARRCGAAPSGVDRSRLLPLFEFAIPSRPPAMN